MRILLLFIILQTSIVFSQEQNDSLIIRSIYDEALLNGHAYDHLRYLCKEIGPRLSGSENSYKAIEWGKRIMESYHFDSVFLQEVMVPVWKRGKNEKLIVDELGEIPVLALGGSVDTEKPVEGLIVEVKSLEEARSMTEDQAKDKILFFNQAMNPRFINTFRAYGACAEQRWAGASIAGSKGASAAIVRSLGLSKDRFPHTGSMGYEPEVKKIPGAAISTESAYQLSQLLMEGTVNAKLQLSCKSFPDTLSYNLIAEIRGNENPDNIILVGGHIDSWDVGEGAHDDGAGIVQSLEVIRLLRELKIQPKNTIRCVWFINEENGNRGGKTYADISKEKGWNHIAALESDRGGFSPRGIDYDGNDSYILEHIRNWRSLLEPYGLHEFNFGYSGVDIRPLKNDDIVLLGLSPDSQRYFDYHHSARDVFEAVNKRELELGAAAMTSIIYLIDQYGFPEKLKD